MNNKKLYFVLLKPKYSVFSPFLFTSRAIINIFCRYFLKLNVTKHKFFHRSAVADHIMFADQTTKICPEPDQIKKQDHSHRLKEIYEPFQYTNMEFQNKIFSFKIITHKSQTIDQVTHIGYSQCARHPPDWNSNIRTMSFTFFFNTPGSQG